MEARARERRRRRRTLLTTALALAIIAVAAVADGARAPARPHAIREEEHQPQRPEDGEEEPQVDTVHVVFSNHLVSVRESGARVLLVADESEWCRWTHPLSRSLPRAAPSSPPTHTHAPKNRTWASPTRTTRSSSSTSTSTFRERCVADPRDDADAAPTRTPTHAADDALRQRPSPTTNPIRPPPSSQIALSEADPSFVFTTHAYLLSLFFDCPAKEALALRCPSPEEKQALAAAIARGSLSFHAAPFNPQYEALFDPSLLRYAIEGVAHRLDRRFGFAPKRVVSLRDVPGLTRAALPALAASGVRAISHGVNGFSAPPGVLQKNTPLLWRDPGSNASMLYFVHPGGYGGVKRGDGCVTHARSRLAICQWWHSFDNGGPPANASEVQRVIAEVRSEFPEAREVRASTFEAYLDGLEREVGEWWLSSSEARGGGGGASSSSAAWLAHPAALAAFFGEPMEQEIGDTWIHGIGSDVTRLADYRAAVRARRDYCRDSLPGCAGDDDPVAPSSSSESDAAAVAEFTRMLLKVAEHTWGVAFPPFFGDFSNYTNAYLHAGIGFELQPERRSSSANGGDRGLGDDDTDGGGSFLPDSALASNYAAVVRSWRRQYSYLEAARRALPEEHPIRRAWERDASERAALAAREEEKEEQQQRGRQPLFVRGAAASTDSSSSSSSSSDDDCSPFPIRFVHWSLAFDRCTGALASLRRRRWDDEGQERPSSADWASGGGDDDDSTSGRFALLRYDVYGEEDYEPVWRDYAYVQPPWVGDFGKLNLTQGLGGGDGSSPRRVVGAVPTLVASFFTRDPPARGGRAHLRLVLRFDDELVREAGAPAEAVVELSEGGNEDDGDDATALRLVVAWRRKAPTRRPEALWLRFAPAAASSSPSPSSSAAAAAPVIVDPSSWRLCKLGDACDISPLDVLRNGSRAMHAVSDAGVTVRATAAASANAPDPASRPHAERLRIASLDAALVAAGEPMPFPSPAGGAQPPPDLAREGVSFNLVNNVWGTNWPMWSPWRAREVDAAFRFVLTAEEEEEKEGGGRGWR
jgi:hypothetical protein